MVDSPPKVFFGPVGAFYFDGVRHLLVDVTVGTPTMPWQDTEAFLQDAELAKEKRYYEWLRSVQGQVKVFYAAVSVHMHMGEGPQQLIQFCSNRSAEWAGALEQ